MHYNGLLGRFPGTMCTAHEYLFAAISKVGLHVVASRAKERGEPRLARSNLTSLSSGSQLQRNGERKLRKDLFIIFLEENHMSFLIYEHPTPIMANYDL